MTKIRPSVALCMIVKNEEENLPRVLGSVKDCFDGIFITDTGSTDKTVEVAEKLGAKVSHFKWIGDFAAARNASFDAVPDGYDYVMWLDADDILTDAEGFKLFRDNVMGLYDFHLATYHYALDDAGKPICSFVRERVFRRDKGLRWKYFVHEGVIPVSPYGEVKINFARAWTVTHMRTASDLEKDRSRNLNLFEPQLDKLDPRMMYYYGKELFENGQGAKGLPWLLKAINHKELEPHDRVLAMQFMGFAYMQAGEYLRAIDICTTGLQFAPNRAEYFCIIADSYVKLNQHQNSIPFYNAARACTAQAAGTSPIFHHESSYGEIPTVQLSRIYANMGLWDKAEEEARRAIIHFQSKEGASTLEEIKKFRGAQFTFKDAVPCDDIVISGTPQSAYEWDPGIAKTKAMGGSETAAIEMAYWLHKLSGKPVKVFNMRSKAETFDGVEYLPATELPDYMSKHKPSLHIAWRHNFKVTDAQTFLWCHDLFTQGGEDHRNYARIMALTPFHKRYLMATQGIPEEKIYVTRNGLKPERFKDGPWIKDPNKFVFGSSPDRGLDRAMRVLDKVRERHPEIKLHVFYGIEHLPKYGHQQLHDTLLRMFEERREWVVYHGPTQQEELMRHYKEASYHVQPSDFVETSCIQAKELVACGIHPIFRRVGGVADTLAEAEACGQATLVNSDCITESEHQIYVDAVLKVMAMGNEQAPAFDIDAQSWENVAKEWLRDLPSLA